MDSFWSGRRIAITGATGFVGYHVAGLLGAMGAEVVALVRATSRCGPLASRGVRCVATSLDDAASLGRAAQGCEFFFHLAGAVDFQNDWDRFQRVNVQGTRHVVAAAQQAGVRRLIHTSSIVAVGACARPTLLDETAPWNLEPLQIPYITTKRQAEVAALEACHSGLDVVVVNPACVIGPDDFSHSEFGTLCKRFWRGRIPCYFGGGGNYVDVRDVAWGHLQAARHGRMGERYLLAGHNRACGEFFADLARTAGRRFWRLRLPNALADALAWLNDTLARGKKGRSYLTAGQAKLLRWYFYFDSAKAGRELGYHARPLEDTLRDSHAFWMNADAA